MNGWIYKDGVVIELPSLTAVVQRETRWYNEAAATSYAGAGCPTAILRRCPSKKSVTTTSRPWNILSSPQNMSESTPKRILDSALTALLRGLEMSPWIKVPATFIAELSKRFSSLPPEEKQEVARVGENAIMSSIPFETLIGNPPKPEVIAGAIQEAIFRSRLLDYLYGLTQPGLDELISRIAGARPNVSETAARRTQVAQLVDWVESTDGPGLIRLGNEAGF